MPDQCTISPDCERGRHDAQAHPCGRRPAPAGSPCDYCGKPLPDQGTGYASACPDCTIPMTIPMLKGFAAEQGWDTTLTIAEDPDA